MNYKPVLLHLVSVLFIIQLANSDTITKVLQNGNSSYEGCKDAYTYGDRPDMNYGDSKYLHNCNCQS